MNAKLILTAGVLMLGLSTAAMAQTSGRNADPYIGKNTDCQAAYKYFRSTFNPVFFAVAEGSKLCVYTYCRAACRTTNARTHTAYRCEKESGTNCEVYSPDESIPGITQ